MNGHSRYDITFSSNHACKCAQDLIPNVVAIDSRGRDDWFGTTSSSYTVTLPHPYRDAVSMEIVYADIPNGNYNVTTNNNRIYIRVAADINDPAPDVDLVPAVVTIEPGYYSTIDDLCLAIVIALNDQFPGANFNVAVDPIGYTNRILFSSAALPFTLYFQGPRITDTDGSVYYHHQPQSIATVLGFSATNFQCETLVGPEFVVYGTGSYNIEMDGAVSLHIENMERCDSNSDTISNAFCLLPLTTISPVYGLLKDGDTIQNDDKVHYFCQPQKLARLRISFRDWHGNIYNFNGYEHLIIFKIMTRGGS